MTEVVKELKAKMEHLESDGSQVIGIHLTAELSKAIRWELHQMYGVDYGDPSLLFGAEVLSHDADELRFET